MDHIAKLLPATALILLLLGFPGAEAAKVCKPSYFAPSGAWPNESTGKAAARADWSAKVAAKYTPKFANWGNASGKSQKCKKTTSPVGVNTYSCWARAKPCAYE